jgi:hypothetical protein
MFSMKQNSLLLLLLFLFLSACQEGKNKIPDDRLKDFNNFTDSFQGSYDKDAQVISVKIPAQNDNKFTGHLTLTLMHVNGIILVKKEVDITGAESQDIEVSMNVASWGDSLKDSPYKLGLYVIQIELQSGEGIFIDRESLYELISRLELVLLGSSIQVSGLKNSLHVFSQNSRTGEAWKGVKIKGSLTLADNSKIDLKETAVDANGHLLLDLPFPSDYTGKAKLIIDGEGEDAGSQTSIEAEIEVTSDARILLTTDKPIYQPSQRIHMRALGLYSLKKLPIDKQDFVFEVFDAKQNKVFKKTALTNEYGVASADFQLADTINEGTFKLRLTYGETVVEKDVKVEKYVLPKFKIELTLDKAYYHPGDEIQGSIVARYFFGKPVQKGSVKVNFASYDVDFTVYNTVEGFSNDEGLFSFKGKVPDYVVGQPLSGNKGIVMIDISVTDAASHEQKMDRIIDVAESDEELFILPESGDIVMNVQNKVFLISTTVTGEPLVFNGDVLAGSEKYAVSSDDKGIAEFSFTPTESPVTFVIKGKIGKTGGEAKEIEKTIKIDPGEEIEGILLRTDKNYYAAGEKISYEVFVPSKRDSVFVDLIKGGQTFLTTVLDAESGKANGEITLDGTITGEVLLEAYYVSKKAKIIRDQRIVFVQNDAEISVNIDYDKNKYLPAENAKIKFDVKDTHDDPMQSAIGVQIVDEAVFALMEFQPGLLKTYFEIEDEISKPKYEIENTSMQCGNALQSEDTDVKGMGETQSQVAFANVQDVSAFNLKKKGTENIIVQMKKELTPYYETFVQNITNEVSKDFSGSMQDFQNLLYSGKLSADEFQKTILDFLDAYGFKDFWLKPVEFEFKGKIDPKCIWCNEIKIKVKSRGPDELKNTEDDLEKELSLWQLGMYGMWMEEDMGGGVKNGEPVPASQGTASETVKVRKYFPETLYVNPAVITDENGHAEIDVTLADSITEWRITAMANSKHGGVGAKSKGLTVFQDFFCDIDLPVKLTQNDEFSVPVALYNYLDEPQNVSVEMKTADWFTLEGPATQSMNLEPGEVTSIYFKIKVLKVGKWPLTAYAVGSKMSDAIERVVTVMPDGKEFAFAKNGYLGKGGDKEQADFNSMTVMIPDTSIGGSQNIIFRVYPKLASHIVEGMESMLKMPFG